MPGKENEYDFRSSGERNGKSLNLCRVKACMRCDVGVVGVYARKIQISIYVYLRQ